MDHFEFKHVKCMEWFPWYENIVPVVIVPYTIPLNKLLLKLSIAEVAIDTIASAYQLWRYIELLMYHYTPTYNQHLSEYQTTKIISTVGA